MRPNKIGLKDKVKHSNLGDKQFLNEIIDFYFENQEPQGKTVEPLNEVVENQEHETKDKVIEVGADNPRGEDNCLEVGDRTDIEEIDIDTLDRQQLFKMAKALKIEKYSIMKTEQLRNAIKEA